jgi:hypothetical protein
MLKLNAIISYQFPWTALRNLQLLNGTRDNDTNIRIENTRIFKSFNRKEIQTALKTIKYYILPAKPGKDFKEIEIYNRAYNFFKQFWSETFSEIKSDREFNYADEFRKQDALSILMTGDEVIGLVFLNYYNRYCLSTFEHSYFKDYPDESLITLKEEGKQHLMTQQHFSISKKFRNGFSGINFAATIVGLSLKVTQLWESPCFVVAREDVASKHIVKNFGFQQIGPSTKMHNVPVSIMGCNKSKDYHKEDVNFCINYLWKKRIDLTK